MAATGALRGSGVRRATRSGRRARAGRVRTRSVRPGHRRLPAARDRMIVIVSLIPPLVLEGACGSAAAAPARQLSGSHLESIAVRRRPTPRRATTRRVRLPPLSAGSDDQRRCATVATDRRRASPHRPGARRRAFFIASHHRLPIMTTFTYSSSSGSDHPAQARLQKNGSAVDIASTQPDTIWPRPVRP